MDACSSLSGTTNSTDLTPHTGAVTSTTLARSSNCRGELVDSWGIGGFWTGGASGQGTAGSPKEKCTLQLPSRRNVGQPLRRTRPVTTTGEDQTLSKQVFVRQEEPAERSGDLSSRTGARHWSRCPSALSGIRRTRQRTASDTHSLTTGPGVHRSCLSILMAARRLTNLAGRYSS